jgi:signal transduction histidine kinase
MVRIGAFAKWNLYSLLLALCAASLTYSDALRRPDLWWYDTVVATQPLEIPADVLIVEIEADTINRRDASRRGWTKSDTAYLLRMLGASRPAVIYLDEALHLSDPTDSDGQRLLSEAIKASGRVLLPIYLTHAQSDISGFRTPVPEYANAALGLTQTLFTADVDGVVRYVPLSITNEDIRWQHSSVGLGNALTHDLPGTLPRSFGFTPRLPESQWREDNLMLLRALPSKSRYRISTARQILNGEISAASISGQVIIVGMGAHEKRLATPGAWGKPLVVSRLELIAHAFQTFRTKTWPIAGSRVSVSIAAGVYVALVLMLVAIARDRMVLSLTVVSVVLLFVIGGVLLSNFGIWLPIASSVCVLIAAYPLWAWRRLSAIHGYIGSELERLRNEAGFSTSRRTTRLSKLTIDDQLAIINQTSEHLRQSKRFVEIVMDSQPVAIFVLDSNGHVLSANSAAIVLVKSCNPMGKVDHSSVEVIGSNINALLVRVNRTRSSHAGAAPSTCQLLGTDSAVSQGSYAQEVELSQLGSYWMGVTRIRPSVEHSPTASFRADRIIALADINNLTQAQRHREELLRFISHDMRSPLASILAVIELRTAAFEAATDDERFHDIKAYATHTIALAEEFLRIVYASAYSNSNFESVELLATLEAATELVKTLAVERGVSIAFFGCDFAVINGSHNLLVRMFANLLDNAIKFSPEGGTVSIAVVRAEDCYEISIYDNGDSLTHSSEQIEKLFEPFSQFTLDLTSLGAKGIGLGLAFVRVVAEKHEGTVKLERIETGTRVSIKLPAQVDASKTASAQDQVSSSDIVVESRTN